jgi:hypothetical protein
MEKKYTKEEIMEKITKARCEMWKEINETIGLYGEEGLKEVKKKDMSERFIKKLLKELGVEE